MRAPTKKNELSQILADAGLHSLAAWCKRADVSWTLLRAIRGGHARLTTAVASRLAVAANVPVAAVARLVTLPMPRGRRPGVRP